MLPRSQAAAAGNQSGRNEPRFHRLSWSRLPKLQLIIDVNEVRPVCASGVPKTKHGLFAVASCHVAERASFYSGGSVTGVPDTRLNTYFGISRSPADHEDASRTAVHCIWETWYSLPTLPLKNADCSPLSEMVCPKSHARLWICNRLTSWGKEECFRSPL